MQVSSIHSPQERSMAPPVKRELVTKVLKVTKTTALVGAAVSLVMTALLPFKRWRLRKLPGPRFKPLIGDLLQLKKAGDSTLYIHNLYVKYSDKPVFKFWGSTKPYVIVRDPKLAKEMMIRCDTHKAARWLTWAQEADRTPVMNILIFINGEKWARGRRALEESVMQASALSAHAPGMQAAVGRLLEVLDKSAATGKPVNVKDCCMAMSLDVITKAIFGVDMHCHGLVDSQAGADALLQSAMAALAAGAKADTSLLTPEQIEYSWWDKYPVGSPEFGKRFVSCATNLIGMLWAHRPLLQHLCNSFPGLNPIWRFLGRVAPGKNARVQLKMLHGVRHGCIKLIDDWKARQQVASTDTETRQQGLLSCSLSDSSREHPVDEVMSMVFTGLLVGYDTSGNSLSMCLYYLSKYPEVQRQAQQEVDSVLGGKVPDSKDMKDLPYLDAFIKEVLRLASPASFTDRCPSSDYADPSGAFRAPAGIMVIFPLYSYHRDPSIWPRPLQFLPERFLPGHEDLAPTEPEMFFPFGVGTRKCPGYKFVLLELRLALARMLQRFEFRPAPGAPEPVMRTSVAYTPDKVVLSVVKRAKLSAV